ncbi:hypothetical protein GOP47_0017654 [Adiantum capillus-veneris]|uniref:FLZ-type domain-containing protein n=1 Tax=Adiantum capillus-veneris TaxID=13818 RepID=A0A9D4UGY7_ADICA|nr:hypothetical protein GOP47_0017654 [Adiantum capillus-veneris]
MVQGCALASQQQRPCQVSEGSCVVDVVCNDLDMEVMAPGCGDNQASSMAWRGNASEKAGSVYTDIMMEGSEMVLQANGGMKARWQEQGPGSLMAYQMGLWIQSSMSHGIHGKLGEEQEGAMSPVDFLDVCFHCKRRLRLERDIYIYRGDTAFCSEECRHRQILIDERRSSRGSSGKRGGRTRASSTSETAVAA